MQCYDCPRAPCGSGHDTMLAYSLGKEVLACLYCRPLMGISSALWGGRLGPCGTRALGGVMAAVLEGALIVR